MVKKTYTIYLVKPTEEQMNQFMSLFIREKFWLESERVKTTRLWCYKPMRLILKKYNLVFI